MDENSKPSTIEKIQNITPSKKDLTRRLKKAERVTKRHARKFLVKRIEKARKAQRKVVFWVVSVGIIIASSAFQLLWFRAGYITSAPSSSGIYSEGLVGQIKSLNPIYASTDAEEALSQLIFSKLFKYDTSGTVGYDLVDNMSVSQNGLEYTFKLKQGVLWQDGEKLDANDVIFTFGLIQNPASRSAITGWSDIKITKVDDLTIKFQLQQLSVLF